MLVFPGRGEAASYDAQLRIIARGKWRAPE
jgi:hypothetical protein